MFPRLLVVRRFALTSTLLAATQMLGCGGAKQSEDAAYAPPPAQPEAYPQPGYPYGQPGGAGADGGAAPPPAPGPMQMQPKTGTTERDFTTLQGALSAFEEEEIRLGEMMDDETIQLAERGTCGRVCDALSSMRRAADAICELAGDDDDRCGKARDTLKSNETRINDAGCVCT